MISLGDWVQVPKRLTTENTDNGNGGSVDVEAEPGDVGHVIEVYVDPPECVEVFFERLGTSTMCHVSELVFLGTAETGRQP